MLCGKEKNHWCICWSKSTVREGYLRHFLGPCGQIEGSLSWPCPREVLCEASEWELGKAAAQCLSFCSPL